MKPKPSTFGSPQRVEMPAIKGQDVQNSVTFGKYDYRGISQADCELPIAPDDHSC